MDGSSGRSTRCHSSTMPVRQSRKSTGIATAPACQLQSIRQAQRGTTESICDLPQDHVSRVGRDIVLGNGHSGRSTLILAGAWTVRIGRTIMGRSGWRAAVFPAF
jgi:hypothetical protein